MICLSTLSCVALFLPSATLCIAALWMVVMFPDTTSEEEEEK
jgi:hypothetical protein